MNYLRIWVHRCIRKFTTTASRQVKAAEWPHDLRLCARRLHCFNKASKHILFLVTLFTSRKKVKLLAGLGPG